MVGALAFYSDYVWTDQGSNPHHATFFLYFKPSSNSSNIEININYSRQLSTIYLFEIISLRLTREQIENRLYM